MFRRALLLIALLSPALLGAGGWYYLNRPFDPAQASPRELCVWLLQNDASTAAAPLQTELFCRCQRELVSPESAINWQELGEALGTVQPEQRATWNRNVRWWCRQWWLSEGRAYTLVALQERAAYLKDKLARWSTNEWVALRKLRRASQAPADAAATSAATPSSLAEWGAEIESWIAAAPPEEQAGLQDFWAALRWQLLMQPKLWKSLSG